MEILWHSHFRPSRFWCDESWLCVVWQTPSKAAQAGVPVLQKHAAGADVNAVRIVADASQVAQPPPPHRALFAR
jgi:hypothetical protein